MIVARPKEAPLFSAVLRAVLVLTCLLSGAQSAYGQVKSVSPEHQARIFLRALAYDRNLEARAKGRVDIAVLFKKGDPSSEALRDRVFKALSRLSSLTLAGLPLRISKLPFESREQFDRELSARGIDTVYLSAGLENSLKEILGTTKAKQVATMSGLRSCIDAGASLGVVLEENRATIVVNLSQAMAEGMRLSSQLLNLAQVRK